MYSLSFKIFFLWILSHISTAEIVPLKNINSRIVNGQNATLGQFPWQAYIYFYGDMSSWVCSGAIIDQQWILTAAHCGDWYISIFAIVGTVEVSIDTEITTFTFIAHENYNSQTLANDIGLLYLEEPLTFTENIQAIDLSSSTLEPDTEIVVTGWGQTGDDTPTSDYLNYVNLVTINNTDCDEIYGGGMILDEMVCAVSARNSARGSTCFGDSGGPAIVYDNENPVLVAITGFMSARGCEYGDPSGFTRVAGYVDWIRQQIETFAN